MIPKCHIYLKNMDSKFIIQNFPWKWNFSQRGSTEPSPPPPPPPPPPPHTHTTPRIPSESAPAMCKVKSDPSAKILCNDVGGRRSRPVCTLCSLVEAFFVRFDITIAVQHTTLAEYQWGSQNGIIFTHTKGKSKILISIASKMSWGGGRGWG